ncbi:GroES-like protein [Conidiobolus coronatus NRRL 28638]|uniref:GroES-like protein n=1 Tax=Conidiobolus coronatus (strain ATCC 28846 / CBS 209.66 / NRRL 28638) TaxID=796925 RepID=A0A137PAW7_CONC2|nr:GroES-like protein [Conidiobolus coronatus NRRL 28638]|eukprot:KXN72071.1 GroES-like protein [Conidiobolus coronatus NRRL 28638]
MEKGKKPLGTNDVEIEISHCGICGSDLHTIDSGWGPAQYPVVAGHEIIGTITAIGPSVTNLKIGDRVGVGAQVGACLTPGCKQCLKGANNLCPQRVMTYNHRWPDNEKTYGGYAEAIRIQSDYAIKVPENLPSEYAAPLMCAGATVFSPMVRYNIKKGDAVGIVGIGGLGHLALQFANKLGAEVYALSRSDNKKEECLSLGATHFVNTLNPKEVNSLKDILDYLIVTGSADNTPWDEYASLVQAEGKIILLAIPELPVQIYAGSIVMKSITLTGSAIASIQEMKNTLEFAAKHKIYPLVQEFPMIQLNKEFSMLEMEKLDIE